MFHINIKINSYKYKKTLYVSYNGFAEAENTMQVTSHKAQS